MTYETKNEGRRGRRSGVSFVVLVALAALTACGGGGDDATKFAGPWTFESGQLVAACGQTITAPDPVQLRGLSVTITKVNNAAFDLVAGSPQNCTLHFSVSGNKASSAPVDQTCILDVGAPYNEQPVKIHAWTLELTGEHLSSSTTASVVICSLSGTGVLARGLPDAGAPPPADGGVDATVDTAPDGGADATAEAGSDATAEVGTDAAPDAGTDASTTEAGSDATSEAGTDADLDATAG